MRIFFLFCLLGLIGCGESKPLPGDVVAKVNGYSITSKELEREIAASWPVLQNFQGLSAEALKAKVLDSMIVNQLLIEEAQRLNVDKDPGFMRRIEQDWREELLKAVLVKKNAEFSRKVPATEASLRVLYARETEELELDLVTLSDKAAAEELSSAPADDFERTIEILGGKVVLRTGPGWWASGDLPEALEEKLWDLPAGKVSPLLWPTNEGWIVARVLSREKVNLLPFEEVREGLQKRLARKKLSNMTDLWIDELRSRAKIFTDSRAVEKLKLSVSEGTGGRDGK
ncbi:MAG: peptidylprolyl isomerase [Candidatus Omnitrophota bacterium]